MTTLTVQAEDEVVAKASEAASRRHASLDEVLAEALLAVATGTGADVGSVLERLKSQQVACAGEGAMTRDERNYRPSTWLTNVAAEEKVRDNGNHFLGAVREAGTFYASGTFSRDELNER